MNPYYECHITFLGDATKAEEAVGVIGWKFSKIDGDPALGKGVKMYATNHYRGERTQKEVIESMHTGANVLQQEGYEILRQKVELVIYDKRETV